EISLEKDRINVFDNRVDTGVLIVNVQTRVHLTRRRDSEPAEERHGRALMHLRGVLRICPENEVLQSEKIEPALIAAEVELERGFDIASAALAVRLDTDFGQRDVLSVELPMEFDGKPA